MYSLLGVGAAVGALHFVLTGLLYANPLVDRWYAAAMADEPGVRRWPQRGRYLVTQLLGTQVEIYLLAAGFLWLRPRLAPGWQGTAGLALFFAALRVYPRGWNMWIQSTYPRRLIAVETVNGVIGTVAAVVLLQLLR